MTAVWSAETKYRIWFEIEAHAADAMAEVGVIPTEVALQILETVRSAKIDVERLGVLVSDWPGEEALDVRAMGIEKETVPTQVVPRYRHAAVFTTLSVVASSLERVATKLRHLQRWEVMEAKRCFPEKHNGTTALP